jgi:DNA-binding CsgD family transcriptional regulator
MAERIRSPLFVRARELVEAVTSGRRGEREEATALFGRAYGELSANALGRGTAHSCAIVASRAALRDGWGEPERWLLGAEAFFASAGHDLLARRCRIVLRDVGAPVPRRGRGSSTVPPELRARGVTSREVDVLQLVVQGRSNKEIAAELFVSPKTVERHLSSVFGRLDVTNRQELAERVRPYLGDTAP